MRHALLAGLGFVFIIAWASEAANAIVVRSASGANPAAIQASVDQFRLDLGDPVNANNPGPLGSGRREINWDGGGAIVASPAPTPFAGFQNTRGALFTTPGTGFLQTPLDAPELTGINPTYSTAFAFFSPQRIFTSLGSNITDVTFTIPGDPATPALVSGFGAIFTDVDLADVSSLQFFDKDGDSLAQFFVPVGTTPDASLSFLGLSFDDAVVARVRITAGNTALGPNDNPTANVDVAALDDVFYGEPQAVAADAIPEPMPATLTAVSLALLGVAATRRKHLG